MALGLNLHKKIAEKMGDKVGENPAAPRAAVFSLSSKNLRGAFKRPPPAGRGLKNDFLVIFLQTILFDIFGVKLPKF